MTDAERRALVNQIIAYQEHVLRLFARLRQGTDSDPAVLAADRKQRAAQQATIAIGQEE